MSVERQLEFTILSFIESTSGYRAGERKRGLDCPEGRTSLPDGNLEILLFAPFVAALSEALVRLEGVGGIKEGVRSSLVVTWTQGRGNKIAHRGLGRGRGIERLEGEVLGGGRGFEFLLTSQSSGKIFFSPLLTWPWLVDGGRIHVKFILSFSGHGSWPIMAPGK